MKKYYSPKTECMTIVKGSIICGLSGTNDSGTGQQENPDVTPGSGSSQGWGLPRRRVF